MNLMRIGLVSDTHGLLRDEAIAFLLVAITSSTLATSVMRRY